jgi:hypothetical protein
VAMLKLNGIRIRIFVIANESNRRAVVVNFICQQFVNADGSITSLLMGLIDFDTKNF